ncbi:hypothetical protein OSB04_025166 [Centaurea solstitialis]|uniref:Reverse transcriptase Ty1/copia-type domain-containing protein n=1 Tax=Centaurea solstitialis TaxID=347529 RepID=A0AA38SMM1_9ASTR|nr:hypothetical protein OSB04_025166 [Centaurea solstitialis]
MIVDIDMIPTVQRPMSKIESRSVSAPLSTSMFLSQALYLTLYVYVCLCVYITTEGGGWYLKEASRACFAIARRLLHGARHLGQTLVFIFIELGGARSDLPQHCRAVGRKWVFKKKSDMDGNVHTFKARLVAKGFTQTHGIDYDETFSPVAMLKSIRILMAISAYFNYEIWQMDVKTTFLNGKLTEDVYMQQPEGFVDPKNPNKVCKLLKSIYGLKQASRSWNLHFDDEFEPCVYTKFSGSIVTFLVLYLNDILLIGNDIPTLQSVKAWLRKCFQMKDLGEAAYILGIKIYINRSRRLIGLSQGTYIDKVLKRFRMDEFKK